MPGKGPQPGPRAIGEGIAAAAAATGAGQKRRRGREGRSGRRREAELVAVDAGTGAGAAGGEVGVAIGKVRLRLDSGEWGLGKYVAVRRFGDLSRGHCPAGGGGRALQRVVDELSAAVARRSSLLRACDAVGRLGGRE